LHHDKRGLPITAASQAAVDAFDASVDEFLASGRDAALLLKRIADVDPDMIMGQCLRGYFMRLPSLARLTAQSHDALAKAEALAPAGTDREQKHVKALAAWCAGDLRGTTAIWESILVDHPHDMLALRLAHFLHFFLGDLPQMRDSMARLMPRWAPDIPGYGYVLGCRAFSLEENGDYAQAEPLGRKAVEINENDIWAGHAVAHVLEMQGRRQDGIKWVDSHEDAWRERGIFAHHIWWHRALCYLELEQFDAVMNAYDNQFWTEPSEDNTDICNASAMLMRLDMLGLDVGDRWSSIAEVCATRIDERLRPFNDMHYVMALTMDGRRDDAVAMVNSMRAFCEDSATKGVTVADTYRNAGIPVAEAIIAHGDKNYARVVDIMRGARYEMRPLGGSWAQRDVWVRMFIHAAIKDNQNELARALLAERTAANPTSGPTWKTFAETLAKCGASADADSARAKAAALLAA
jgi:tetratricopeptide (TPR) repeat protein